MIMRLEKIVTPAFPRLCSGRACRQFKTPFKLSPCQGGVPRRGEGVNRRLQAGAAKGFTLLELLVVIAIIAVLLAVIIPALNTAKLIAKQVVCSARTKQWTLAALAYAADNDSEIPPYADTCDWPNGQNALDPETYWYNRLSSYLTREYHGKWGMDYNRRQCPMGRTKWGETAVWIGVYFNTFEPYRAPFVFLNNWNGSTLTKKCDPFKTTSVKMSSSYLMMLDVRRDDLFDPVHWPWDTDFDGDGMKDSNSGVIGAGLSPYNHGQPKIHRSGCNISLFDGHTEWISYKEFWEFAPDGYPVHRYWYNNNRP